MFSYLSLFALVATGALSLASQTEAGRFHLARRLKTIFLLAAAVILGAGAYLAFNQYQLWSADPLAKFLLPPHQNISYFVSYSFTHFFAPYLLSLAAGLVLLFVMKSLNKKFGERFFEKEEPALAAISVFLVGHPGWLIYLAAIIFAYLILHVFWVILRHEAVRLPLYRLWVPVAFFVILLNEIWLSNIAWWQLLRI